MELAAIETVEEQNAVLALANNFPNLKLFNDWTNIDGIASVIRNKVEWYHSNGLKISYALNWAGGQPDGFGDYEACLQASRTGSTLHFNDEACGHQNVRKFICQSEESREKL
jgi:hypothetical protein